MKSITLDGVTLELLPPDPTSPRWIGQPEPLRQLQACWLDGDETDPPLTPRITGVPGTGKTTLAMACAALRGQPCWVQQCTSDTRPEDLLVTPVLAEKGAIAYHASPLVTAMIRGGVCVLDEGNRMNEKSWASLAPLLDHRRFVESIIAGIAVRAHADFRCAVTMNEDDATYEIPDYILSRLQPTLKIGFPSRADEMAILTYHLPFAAGQILDLTVDFLQRAHALRLDFSPRDGMNIIKYAVKRLSQRRGHPLAEDAVWREAVERCLGEDALDLKALSEARQRSLGSEVPPLGLGDFFLRPDDPLNPDADEPPGSHDADGDGRAERPADDD